jgi:hypothetical protein
VQNDYADHVFGDLKKGSISATESDDGETREYDTYSNSTVKWIQGFVVVVVRRGYAACILFSAESTRHIEDNRYL